MTVLFIYSWLPWVLIAALGLSLAAVSRGTPLKHRFLTAAASLAAEQRL